MSDERIITREQFEAAVELGRKFERRFNESMAELRYPESPQAVIDKLREELKIANAYIAELQQQISDPQGMRNGAGMGEMAANCSNARWSGWR
jgi:hypothetical protein